MKRLLALLWVTLLSTLALLAVGCGSGGDEPATGPAKVDSATDGTTDTGSLGSLVLGGTVVGLEGSGLVLSNNGGDELPITANGTFTFPSKLSTGDAYEVGIKTQPTKPNQTCSVTGGKGVMGSANVTTVVVNCGKDRFPVGGTVSGLSGKGLLLSLNGMENAAITSNGAFSFTTLLESGTAYEVKVVTHPTEPAQKCTLTSATGTMGTAPVTSVKVTCQNSEFAVAGTVTGLEGTGLVLQNNGGDDISIAVAGTFKFPKPVLSGNPYAVTVKGQPTSPSQVCTVSAGSGTVVDADVTTVAVTCTTNVFKVKGSVVGLAGSGLVLQDNGGDDLAITADGAFAFATPVKSGAAFAVTVKTQPTAPAQTCTVAGATGTVAASDVTSVIVNCANDRYTVGGTVIGLAGKGLALQNNAGDDLDIGANGGFAFATPLTSGAAYAVTIKAQPTDPSQTCVVVGGTGSVGAGPVGSVVISCSRTLVVVGGTVTGLKGAGLVLQDNGGDDLKISGNGTFAFATALPVGASYAITVKSQPTSPTQTCTIVSGTGTTPSTAPSVTTATISCVTETFSVGGTVSGLTGSGLVLQDNGGDDLAISGNGPFTFPTKLLSGGSYTVTVKSQPTGPTQTCTLTGGAGVVGGAPVTSVNVTCKTEAFTVGGTVTGLKGSGLVLQNNLGDDLTVGSDGTFTFGTPVLSGAAYSVSVKSQPTGPSQSCVVTAKSGTVGGGNVTSVLVTCTTNTYAVGGSVSGLVGTGLVLQNNLGDDLTITGNGSFAFPTKLASGDSYKVTVKTQPSGPTQTCAISGGIGNVGGGPVTGVVVNCATDSFTVGGTVSGLDGTGLRLLLNGGSALEITGNGSFAFSGAISSGTAYTVTVDSQPTTNSQTCTVTSGTGTIGSANVSSVTVTCVTNPFTVAVNVSGLSGTGLVVKNNGETQAITGNGETPFPTKVLSGATYNVSVSTQPTSLSQTCTVASGVGTMGNGKVVVNVTCTTNSFTVGGTVTGLALDSTLVLRNQAGVDVTVTGTGSPVGFNFTTPVLSGSGWSVVVQTRPTTPISQNCTVTGGSGTMGAANVSVAVNCTTNTFLVNARVIGLSSGTLVLQNGADTLSFTTNATKPFATRVASGATYAVTVKTQPSVTQVCTVSLGSGTIGDADVTVTVNCANTYTVGGTIYGLGGGSIILQNNGGDDVPVTGNGTFPFVFSTPLVSGSSYSVTVKTQPGSPKWQTCLVTNAAGTITANVSNVTVTCTTNTYSVGGTVTGLGTGTLVLQDNGGDNLSLTSASLGTGGSFRFATKIASGATYSATVLTSPTTPGFGQTCTVTSGSGTVAGADVTSIAVTCVNNYSIGGSIVNLVGDGLVLGLTVNGVTSYSTASPAAGSTGFTFPKAAPSGATYSVTIATQPTKYYQTCTVGSGSGTVGSGNVTSVVVTCGSVTKIVLTSSTFTVSGVVQSVPASIPDSDDTCSANVPGIPLLSEIIIPANYFTVNKTTVQLGNISHSYLGDLTARLELEVSSTITASTSLFDRVGRYVGGTGCGSSSTLGGNYGFDDVASTSLWSSSAAGTYHAVGPRASSAVTGFTFLDAAPTAGFKGAGTNGKWRLVLTDMANSDTGTINSWTLTLTP